MKGNSEKRRAAMIKAIHAERNRTNGMDEESYRDFLQAEFGVRSSTKLTIAEMRRLLSIFGTLNGPRDGSEKRQEAALRERAREIADKIPDGENRLQGLVKHFFDVDRLEWVQGVDNLVRLLAALGKIERDY